MVGEIADQAGLGFAEFVRVNIGFHSFEGRLPVLATVSPNVGLRVLRHSRSQSARHVGADYHPGCKKEDHQEDTQGGPLSSLSIGFRSSFAALHNLHPRSEEHTS